MRSPIRPARRISNKPPRREEQSPRWSCSSAARKRRLTEACRRPSSFSNQSQRVVDRIRFRKPVVPSAILYSMLPIGNMLVSRHPWPSRHSCILDIARPFSQCYNRDMQSHLTQPDSGSDIDRSLLEWFLSLTPEQRLEELESRVGFLLSLRAANESQLSRDT